MIKTDKVPRIRKFKELLEQMEKDGVSNNCDKKQNGFDEEYYYKKYENSSAKCPLGFTADDKAKNSHAHDESPAKCPLGFTAENTQNGHIAAPNGESGAMPRPLKKPAKWKITVARLMNDSSVWLTASMGLVLAAAFAYHKYQTSI